MSVSISPVLNLPFIADANGNPLNGGKIYAYEGGSFSILQDTFTSSEGDIENLNPIVLTASGSLPPGVMIWLTNGLAYNFLLTDANDVPLRTFENVVGVGSSGGGGGGSTAIWVEAPGATFLTGTSFLVAGNLAAEFAVGNRVRLTQTAGYTYGVISAVSFTSPSTFVTIINDGPVLDASLSLAEYSVLIASPGETVDAGGVSFFDALPYSTANTVGWKLKETETNLANLTDFTEAVASVVERSLVVHTATGSGVDAAYSVTMDPPVEDYNEASIFSIKFSAGSGNTTLNLGAGAEPLRSFNPSGTLVNPTIPADFVSDVAWNGTTWILLDPLPTAAEVIVPVRGAQAFTSNGVFTVPAGVYSLHVTCVGGGGGGGAGFSGDSSYAGRGGGGGAVSQIWMSTTPGTTYSVSIGAGGGPTVSGGTSSFGITLCTAAGGSGATNFMEFAPFTPAAGGSSGTGLIYPGGKGSRGGAFVAGGAPGAGFDNAGGGSPGFSMGNNVGFGSGGNGAETGGPVGSAGNAGFCLITW